MQWIEKAWLLTKHSIRWLYLALFGWWHTRLVRGSGLNPSPRIPPLIVSLTTTPKRIPVLHLTLCTLLRQRAQPDRIIVWLGDEGYGPDWQLPSRLQSLQQRGVEFAVRQELGPHTKLIHALLEHPDSLVVTVDDDQLYPSDWLEGLLKSYRQAPNAIHCYRAREVQIGANGFEPYRTWGFEDPTELGPSPYFFPTGTAGVLYPPGAMHADVFDSDAFRDLCPRADDIWFYAMALRNGWLARKVGPVSRSFPTVPGTQGHSLWETNRYGGNDDQLRRVWEHYGLPLPGSAGSVESDQA